MQLRFEKLLMELSARLVNVYGKDLKKEIRQGLDAIVRFFNVHNGGLFERDKTDETFHPASTLSEKSAGSSWIMVIGGNLPWIRDMLLRGENVKISGRDDDPSPARKDRERLSRMNVGSFLATPVTASGETHTVLWLGSREPGLPWPESRIPRLRLIGEIFANSLMRGRARSRIKKRLEIESAIAGLAAHFINLPAGDAEKNIVSALEKASHLFNFDRSSILQFRSDKA